MAGAGACGDGAAATPPRTTVDVDWSSTATVREKQAALADFLAGLPGADAAALAAVGDGSAGTPAASAALLSALRTDAARAALEAADPSSPVGQLQAAARALAPGDCELASGYGLPSAGCACGDNSPAYLHCLANMYAELQAAVQAEASADASAADGGADGGR